MAFRTVLVILLLTLVLSPISSLHAQSEFCTPRAILDSFFQFISANSTDDWVGSWDCEASTVQAIELMNEGWNALKAAVASNAELSCQLRAIQDSFRAASLSGEIEAWVTAYQSSNCGSDVINGIQILGVGALLLYGEAPEWTDPIVTHTLGVATRTESGDLLISYAQTIPFELENGAGDRWVFDATSEDRMVAITLESSAFNAYMELYDPQGNQLTTDDNSAGGTNARILMVSLAQSGQYSIIVRSYNRTDIGQYNLSLQRASDYRVEFGQSVTNDTPVTGGDLWSFSVEAGEQMVAITLDSSSFNAYLELYDPQGNRLTTDDNSAGSTNARILLPVISKTGLYSLIVRSYDKVTRGSYTLTLERSRDKAINYDETVDVTTPTTGGDLWSFELTEPERMISLVLESDDFNAYLELYDPAGTRITTDDNSAGGTNARIFLTGLDHVGRYTVIARSYDHTTVGACRLTLKRAADHVVTADAPTYMNDPVAGGDLWAYVIEENTGMIAITLESQAFNAYLELYDPQGQRIKTDDNSAGGTNARIRLENLSLAGDYTIIARSYDAVTNGDYDLLIIEAADHPIEFEQTIQVETPITGGDLWSFTAETGQEISIYLESNVFNAYLELYDPNGNRVTTDDNSGGGTNALINYVTTLEGRYTIIARSYDTTTRGSYSLTLR